MILETQFRVGIFAQFSDAIYAYTCSSQKFLSYDNIKYWCTFLVVLTFQMM
ncbi:hypothetical protein EPHNCH_0658 [Anaplasma phagocytophilum str. NCH-1]|uniref:Uncharacterized protein n=1 Tax=Anaplasma phagocytophilum str. NCH-1 TaxID=1359161 RepID=A0A0F3NEM5_ANAPH|nr:hypothetical protein EPHNCH_0658 [Anaplasma phagocytophilum str. NCH-1]